MPPPYCCLLPVLGEERVGQHGLIQGSKLALEVRAIIGKVGETARWSRKRSHVQLVEVRALHLRPSAFLQLVPFPQKQVPEDLANSDYPKKGRLDWKDNRVSDPLYR